MPRFKMNRWWNFILTLCLLSAAGAIMASVSTADIIRADGRDGTIGDGSGGGGAPPPNGIGDPDQPVPSTSLKLLKRGTLSDRTGALSMRAAGDSPVVGNVWMWRLSVMERVLRVFWIRY